MLTLGLTLLLTLLPAHAWREITPTTSCNLPTSPPLPYQTFMASYSNTPTVLTLDASSLVAAQEATSRSNLLSRMGSTSVLLSSSNSFSYAKQTTTLAAYLDSLPSPTPLSDLTPDTLIDDVEHDLYDDAEEAFYLFGDHSKEWYDFIDETIPLPLPARDAPRVSPSFGIGWDQSGVAFHTHGPVFAYTLHGHKRWFLTPPDSPPPFHPSITSASWLTSSNYTLFSQSPSSIDCTLAPGQVLFIPDAWWHATLNIGDTLFISHFV